MKFNLLLLVVLFSSCTVLNTVYLDNERHVSVQPEEVKIFLLKEDLPMKYQKVGVINAYNMMPEKRMKKVRKAASEMGANGIYFEPNQLVQDSLGVPVRIEVANRLSTQTEFVAIRY